MMWLHVDLRDALGASFPTSAPVTAPLSLWKKMIF